jgi:hypothetical protein
MTMLRRRSDFETVLAVLRALLAVFLTARRGALADRLALFAECLLISSI